MSVDGSKFAKWLDYSNGKPVLKKDAPESAKKAYEEFLKAREAAKKKGIKI